MPDAPPGAADRSRVVALDGPSGSGKSTVARAVARALGWRYVDTGATYRAATLAVLRAGVALDDAGQVAKVVDRAGVQLGTDPDAPVVRLGDEDVSAAVRGPEVTAAVSAVSALPEVRQRLTAVQRAAIGAGDAVAEGRDVGTAVAPEAAVKVFLVASPEARAARRAGDADAGVRTTGTAGAPGALVAAVAADLARRDALDSGRATSPTRVAEDAVVLDTTDLSVEQVVQRVLELAAAAGLGPPT